MTGRAHAPSPLPMHLSAATALYRAALAKVASDPDRTREIAALSLARMVEFVDGIAAWRAAPRPAPPARPAPLWSCDTTQAFAFGAPDAPPVLVVPSLINRADILDLDATRSLIRGLAARGLNPILLDWGETGPQTTSFDLAAYVTARLHPALRAITAQYGRRPALLGYCLGGTLAASLAARRPDAVSALVCLAAPWAFPRDPNIPGGALRALASGLGRARLEAHLTQLDACFGCVPNLVYQTLFAAIDPLQAVQKFRAFATLAPHASQAARFVAVEDWLAAPRHTSLGVARDILIHLQLEDRLAKGRFALLGGPVDATHITAPTLVIAGQRDTIAPTPLALPLAQRVAHAHVLSPDLGHVGAIVSARAPRLVWDPIADFLLSQPG